VKKLNHGRKARWMGGVSALAMMLAVACGDTGNEGPDGNGPIEGPGSKDTAWDPSGNTGACNVDALLSVESYATKVKGMLTGLPLSEVDLSTLRDAADPQAELATLIDGWLATPEAEAVLMRFFMTAFQQTGGDVESFFYLQGRNAASTGRFQNPRSNVTHEMLNQNFAESFARTAVELVREGRPFTEVLTTDEVMMTTAQMVFLAYKDNVVVHDDESKTVRTTGKSDYPTIRLVPNQGAAPPASEVFDPNSPNFMTFYHDDLKDGTGACAVTGPITIDTQSFTQGDWRIANGSDFGAANFIYMAMMGRHESVRKHNVNPNCNTGAANRVPLLDRSDFSDWHKVKLVKSGAAGATTFWDLSGIRGASELRLVTDQSGFLTRMGLYSTWPNNEDNSARVTLNQMLIVALGQSFDGEAVSDFTPSDLDVEHAGPETPCYGCHQTLDPMRDFVRASVTNFYGDQLDERRDAMEATFIFQGMEQVGTGGIKEFANLLAQHPAFAPGWVQKLCYFANSNACPEGAELDRVVDAFMESDLDLRVAIRELFSSPLVTGESCVADVDAGTEATIARRSAFCANLSHRLGVDDICGILTLSDDATNLQNDMRSAMASVPDDSFSRSLVEPVTIADTGLFIRANREVACTVAAQNAFSMVYDGMQTVDVIDSLATDLMGLPANDERHDAAVAILTSHVNEAQNEDEGAATETEALQSAFIIACMSPGTAGVGF